MKPNSDHQLPGCSYLNKQLSDFKGILEAAKAAQDTTAVHQARVVCRRLRSGLNFFSEYFEAEKLNRWSKQIKKLLQSLGQARDLDVQIEFLQGFLATLEPEQKKMRPGIERIFLRWKQRREAVQKQVIESIERCQKKHLLINIHLELERTVFESRDNDPAAAHLVSQERLYRRLEDRVKEFLEQICSMDQPEEHTAHHKLRISAKQLRYEMEIGNLILKGHLKEDIKKVKKIQTLLGDLHDCVVWDNQIDEFVRQEKQLTIDYYGHERPFGRIRPGLSFLQRNRQTQHHLLFTQACDYLKELEADHYWQTLLDSLRSFQPDSPEQTENTRIEPDYDHGQ